MTNCPKCTHKMETRSPSRYHYLESGLDYVWLEGGVTEYFCPSCRFRLVEVAKEQQLLQLIARDLLMRRDFLAGPEIRYLRRACGLTQGQLAAALKLNRRETIATWEAQEKPIREIAWEYVLRAALLSRFTAAILEPDNMHLSLTQLKGLRDFHSRFAEVLDEFIARHEKKTLRFKKKRDWQQPDHKKKAA